MSISVTCPECFMDFSVPERFAGKKIKCKACAAAIPVPQPGAAAEADDLEDFGPAFSPPGRPGGPPPRPDQFRPAAAPARVKKQKSSVWAWVAGIAAGSVLAVMLCCGGISLWWRSVTTSVAVSDYPDLPDFGEPTTTFPVGMIPVPKFPDLGPATPVGDAGVQTYNVDLATVPGNEGWPGMKMTMRVYLPPGEHAVRSLPCVLVAPAGTTLLSGVALDDSDYHDETLPYAQAGMAVVHYSLDGDESDAPPEGNPLKAPYLRFRAACAGVVNTRNALEFALAKLPMVNPKQVFAAGHSSAATLALLAAEHEPKLAGVLAYAPATDVVGRMEGAQDLPPALVGIAFPQMKEFLTQSSPLTHLSSTKCPVFLYHSKHDDNTKSSDSQTFVDKLKAAGKDVTFVLSDAGGATPLNPATPPSLPPNFPPGPPNFPPGPGGASQPQGFDVEDDPSGEETAEDGLTEEEVAAEDFSGDEYGFDVHYQTMIDEGIPKGIEWINSRTGT